MSVQELVKNFLVELARNDFRRCALPPIRFISAMVEADATELARVGENKRAFLLKQNEMIVFGRSVIRRFDTGLAGHAEMNSKPAPNVFASPDGFGVVPGKFEEHPFSTRA